MTIKLPENKTLDPTTVLEWLDNIENFHSEKQ